MEAKMDTIKKQITVAFNWRDLIVGAVGDDMKYIDEPSSMEKFAEQFVEQMTEYYPKSEYEITVTWNGRSDYVDVLDVDEAEFFQMISDIIADRVFDLGEFWTTKE
jgi:hypothetical protein